LSREFAVPAALSLLFSGLALAADAFSVPLALLVLLYTFAPALAAYYQGPEPRSTWLDFIIVLMLWLPLEFSAGQHLIPKPAQGFLHSVAYGIAILLGHHLPRLPRAARHEIQPALRARSGLRDRRIPGLRAHPDRRPAACSDSSRRGTRPRIPRRALSAVHSARSSWVRRCPKRSCSAR
jgi:hypothetical protein